MLNTHANWYVDAYSNVLWDNAVLWVFVGSSQTGQKSESAPNKEEEPEKEEGGFFSKLKKMFSWREKERRFAWLAKHFGKQHKFQGLTFKE